MNFTKEQVEKRKVTILKSIKVNGLEWARKQVRAELSKVAFKEILQNSYIKDVNRIHGHLKGSGLDEKEIKKMIIYCEMREKKIDTYEYPELMDFFPRLRELYKNYPHFTSCFNSFVTNLIRIREVIGWPEK